LRETHGMRSVNAPRVAHDATVEIGSGGRARAVNLSTGGIFVAADETFDPGEQVHLKVNLKDGATPLDVDAEVVWKEDGGMALRFKELDDVAKRRITRLVQSASRPSSASATSAFICRRCRRRCARRHAI